LGKQVESAAESSRRRQLVPKAVITTTFFARKIRCPWYVAELSSDGDASPNRSTKKRQPEEKSLKFMIMWKIPPAYYTTAVKRFLKTGAPAPKGLKTIGRGSAGR